MASSGPLPTILTFLSHLPSFAVGCKVRFLGCVTCYRISTGVLELQHTSHACADTTVSALVDVKLLLDHIKREDLVIGAWVNIVGYVQGVARQNIGAENRGNGRAQDAGTVIAKRKQVVDIGVQAVMLWTANSVRLADYEKAVSNRLKVNAVVEAPRK